MAGEQREKSFTRKALGKELGWEPYRVARAIEPLERIGYLDVTEKGRSYSYKLLYDQEAQEVELQGVLMPEELKEKIAQHLDEIDPVYLEQR